MTEHKIHWTSPEPLWRAALTSDDPDERLSFGQPAILRFTTDTFMDDFMAMLGKNPVQLPSLVAKWENWQGPLNPSTDVTGSGPVQKVPKLVRKLERIRLAASRSKTQSSVSLVSSGSVPGEKDDLPMLKLYQPAHQRYYLISACLVCGMTGMPDREVEPGREERVSFVIRRLLPPEGLEPDASPPGSDPADWEEYAYVSVGSGAGWQWIGDSSNPKAETLITGEEQLPLFAINYETDDNRSRRLLSGLIPVGRREAYMAAGTVSGDDENQSSDIPLPKTSRMILFRSQVADPWKSVIGQAERFREVVDANSIRGLPGDSWPSANDFVSTVESAREQIQTQSWLILLDFAKFLKQHLPDVWDVISGFSDGKGLSDNEAALLNGLENIKTPDGTGSIREALTTRWWNDLYKEWVTLDYPHIEVKATMYEALKAIFDQGEILEAAKESFKRDGNQELWPDFLFPLDDPLVTTLTFPANMPSLDDLDDVDEAAKTLSTGSTDARTFVDGITALVVQAMPTETAKPAPPVPLAARPVKDTREGVFVIRAIFERPNCGPLKPTIVSERSQPFQMAGFFDPDAPARPIRIALPIDTSPAGLRKFDKNTAFMFSDILCGQMKRAKGLTFGDLVLSVLPWPFHKDLPVPDTGPCTTSTGQELGTICTLSIPIITICALILLTIIVSLLDIIFKWIPYFTMCFQLPGFKAKK